LGTNTAKDGRGTKCTTYHDAIIQEWDNNKYKRTIPLNTKTRNVGLITAPHGIKKYLKALHRQEHAFPSLAFPTTIDMTLPDPAVVTDDEDDTPPQTLVPLNHLCLQNHMKINLLNLPENIH
jgi:hypothetical protein